MKNKHWALIGGAAMMLFLLAVGAPAGFALGGGAFITISNLLRMIP